MNSLINQLVAILGTSETLDQILYGLISEPEPDTEQVEVK